MPTLLLALLFFQAALPQGETGPDGRPSLSRPLRAAWSYVSEEMLHLSPALHGSHLYLPQAGGKVVSIEAPGGEFHWKSEVGGEISAAPAADEAGVYVATEVRPEPGSRGARSRGVLRLLSPESGVTLWVRQTESPLRGSLAASGGLLYAASREGRVYAFEGKTGEVRWVRQNEASFQAHPLAAGNLLFLGDEAGSFFALDARTGEPLWSYRTRPPFRPQPALCNGLLFVGAADNLYALDPKGGRLLWRARTSGGVLGIACGGEGLVVTTLDNFAYWYAAADGKRHWKRRLPGRVTARPLVTSEGVLLPPLSGDEAVILSTESGKKINSVEVGEDGNTSAAPLLSGHLLLLSTRRGLYAYAN